MRTEVWLCVFGAIAIAVAITTTATKLPILTSYLLFAG